MSNIRACPVLSSNLTCVSTFSRIYIIFSMSSNLRIENLQKLCQTRLLFFSLSFSFIQSLLTFLLYNLFFVPGRSGQTLTHILLIRSALHDPPELNSPTVKVSTLLTWRPPPQEECRGSEADSPGRTRWCVRFREALLKRAQGGRQPSIPGLSPWCARWPPQPGRPILRGWVVDERGGRG